MTKFPWPYVKDDQEKVVYYFIASGWPTVMAGPRKVTECFPDYKGHLCTHNEFQRIKNEQKESH